MYHCTYSPTLGPSNAVDMQSSHLKPWHLLSWVEIEF